MGMKIKFTLLLLVILGVNLSLKAQNSGTEKSLYHVLLLNWSEEADSLSKAEVYTLFKGLPEKIDGFEHISFAPVIRSNQEFDEVVIMIFKNQAALDTYQTHPDHLRIKEIAIPLLNQLSKYDYWE